MPRRGCPVGSGKFHSPSTQSCNQHAPPNAQGICNIAFAVEDPDTVVAGPSSPRRLAYGFFRYTQ